MRPPRRWRQKVASIARTMKVWTNRTPPPSSAPSNTMTRYRLDPVFGRTPDGAVNGIIRYDIYLDGHFVGSRRTHAECHEYLDELMPRTPEPSCPTATIHVLRPPRDP